MTRYVKKINKIPVGVLMLCAFTFMMLLVNIFSGTASNAENNVNSKPHTISQSVI